VSTQNGLVQRLWSYGDYLDQTAGQLLASSGQNQAVSSGSERTNRVHAKQEQTRFT